MAYDLTAFENADSLGNLAVWTVSDVLGIVKCPHASAGELWCDLLLLPYPREVLRKASNKTLLFLSFCLLNASHM